MRINRTTGIITIFILFIFQPFIEIHIPFFKYYDEIISLCFFVIYLIKKLMGRRNNWKDFKFVGLLIFLAIIGIIGNFRSEVGQETYAIIQDIVSNFKLIVFAYSVRNLNFSEKEKCLISDRIAFIIRGIFIVMFITSILSLFLDIGMSAGIRYALKSYTFIFQNPAVLNTYFYMYFVLYSITLYKNGKLRKWSNLYTIMGLIPWVLTLRSRAFAFAFIYFVLYFYFVFIRKSGIKTKLRCYYFVIFGIIAVLIGWDAIETYFISNDQTARYQLLKTSFGIAREYFPIGSGFGTFGTEASKAFYSRLYYRYNLVNIYGLSNSFGSYITDQYWFGILAQFGYVGAVMYALIIYKMYKEIWSTTNGVKANQITAITLIYTGIFSSFTEASFIQASVIASVIAIYVFRADGNKKPK